MSRKERKLHNSNLFKEINEESEIQHEYDREHRQNDNATYQLVNLKRLEETINRTCVCTCRLNKHTDDFLEYCANIDENMTCGDMMRLRKQWEEQREKKNHQ